MTQSVAQFFGRGRQVHGKATEKRKPKRRSLLGQLVKPFSLTNAKCRRVPANQVLLLDHRTISA
jgi:hypothetical protein